MSEKKCQTIEEKQYLVRFNTETKSHLTVMDADICLNHCPDKICTIFCPAEVYKWEEIRMHVGYEGCHECGSCLIGCPHQNIKWEYPKRAWDCVSVGLGGYILKKKHFEASFSCFA
jgi:ferredoxin like protein